MNGDGILSENEVLDIISQEDLKSLFFEMDGDGDGQIDYSVSSYKSVCPLKISNSKMTIV